MNTLTVIMLGLILLGLNVGLIALAVQLGTHKLQNLLTELVALQMTEAQQRIQQQVEQNLHRQVHPNLQQPGPAIPPQR